MSMTPEEAAQALKDVERTETLSVRLRGYAGAAPHFMLWGAIWALCYGLTDFFPESRNLIWGGGVAVGAAGGFVLGRVNASTYSSFDWRFVAVAGVMAAYLVTASFVLGPLQPRQFDAFIPLLFAVTYTAAGLWLGWRFTICGVALWTVTILAYVFAGAHFDLCMAVAGGGVLALTGFWLRRA